MWVPRVIAERKATKKARRFLAECLFQESAYPEASARVALTQLRRWTQKVSVSLVDLVRLRVEFDILNDVSPNRWQVTKVDFVKAISDYVGDKEYAEIEIENCTRLVQSRDKIQRYFENLPKLLGGEVKESDPNEAKKPDAIKTKTPHPNETKKPDPRHRFLWNLKVNEGYVAAQHLIYGLLDRYGEDWKRILHEYANVVGNSEAKSLVEKQLFQLNCWLLWGPSIPICTCKAWAKTIEWTKDEKGKQIRKISRADRRLLQFGYGDENNSVFLDVPEIEGEIRTLNTLAQRLSDTSQGSRKDDIVVNRLALKVDDLRGRLFWSEKMLHCEAQQDLTLSDRAQPVLRIEGSVPRAPLDNWYFSAYLWVMFVLCRGDDTDKKPHSDEWTLLFDGNAKWRNLLPFFEHGNIADKSTLIFHRAILVAKVVSGITKLLEENPRMRLRYVCASDDSLCEKTELGSGEYLLRKLLNTALNEKGIPRQIRNRIEVPESAPSPDSDFKNFVSCKLPILIKDYEDAAVSPPRPSLPQRLLNSRPPWKKASIPN